MKTIILGAILLACIGCTESTLNIRPVQDEPSVFVGLSNPQAMDSPASVQLNHPMEWSESDLHMILGRLLVQGRAGMMDPYPEPKVVFSADEVILLTPGLRETFESAQSSDWIAFALWSSDPISQALEVTSGGMFLKGQRLHVILSNHRERVSSEQEGIKGIRSNPFHSLRDIKKGKLSFDPTRYMIESRDNWLAGGYDAPSSELVIDIKDLLASPLFSTPNQPERYNAEEKSGISSNPTPATESEVGELKEKISNLKDELSRLQDLITQQAKERSQQKTP